MRAQRDTEYIGARWGAWKMRTRSDTWAVRNSTLVVGVDEDSDPRHCWSGSTHRSAFQVSELSFSDLPRKYLPTYKSSADIPRYLGTVPCIDTVIAAPARLQNPVQEIQPSPSQVDIIQVTSQRSRQNDPGAEDHQLDLLLVPAAQQRRLSPEPVHQPQVPAPEVHQLQGQGLQLLTTGKGSWRGATAKQKGPALCPCGKGD